MDSEKVIFGCSLRLFPAHAGVILVATLQNAGLETFPRPRGGDPKTGELVVIGWDFSPPTRG